VEANHDHIDDDAPLHPVFPVAEVKLLTVHQLEDLLGRQDQGGHDEQDPHHYRAPGYPALFFIRYKTAPTNTFKALCSLNAGKVSDVVGEAVATVILEDALVGVDKEHKCGMKHREYEMEGEADKKKTF